MKKAFLLLILFWLVSRNSYMELRRAYHLFICMDSSHRNKKVEFKKNSKAVLRRHLLEASQVF